MGIRTTLHNGSVIKASGLFVSTLRFMHDHGYFKDGHSPFYISPDDLELYLDSSFTLTRTDMLHVATLMFQRLFPTSSWKATWKRKDGKHAQWITTAQAVQLVVIGKHYHAIDQGIQDGHVTTDALLKFAFFRNMADELTSFGAEETVRRWMEWVFLTTELMRELDCKGAKPTSYSFS